MKDFQGLNESMANNSPAHFKMLERQAFYVYLSDIRRSAVLQEGDPFSLYTDSPASSSRTKSQG